MMNDSFNKLQPLCNRIVKSYSTDDLKELKYTLEEIDKNSFQVLQEYIIFPVQLTLMKEQNKKIITECVEFLSFVFENTIIETWKVFWNTLNEIMQFIVKLSLNHSSDEELARVICNCIISMFLHCENDILCELYNVNYSPILAHYVHSLLNLLKSTKCKALRLNAVECISVLLYSHEDIKMTMQVKIKARERIAAVLPGVTIAIRDIICGDDKQGHKILIKALLLLSKIIYLTFEDNSLTDNYNINMTSENIDKSDWEKIKNDIPCIIRNDAWIKMTREKLLIVFENILMVASHNHWKVRMALAKSIEIILCHCASNLDTCLVPLLQMSFALSVDSYDQISNFSRNSINVYVKGKLKLLNSVLKEDLDLICSRIISIHLSLNDDRKLFLLKAIHGYFQILGPSIKSLVYSSYHLNKFCKTMLKLIQFDMSDIIYVEQNYSSLDINVNMPKLWPRKCFKYFQDVEIVSQISSIFYVLGFYTDVQVLIDYFIECLCKFEFKNECIFLIIKTLASLNEKEQSNHIWDLDCYKNFFLLKEEINFKVVLISNILEEFLLPVNFEISNISYSENYNINVARICLILEGISNFASILGIYFRPLLMTVLCPVMEKAGSSITVIEESAKLSLHSLALYCEYSSVAELISDNIDYLINNIEIGFRHFLQKSEIVIVLRVALELADCHILPLFKDPFNQLFLCLDYNQNKAVLVMRIFLSIVSAIKKWFSDTPISQPVSLNTKNPHLKAYLLERDRLKKISNCTDANDDNIHGNSDNGTLDKEIENLNQPLDEKNELPFHIKLISNILERCVHLQSSDDLELRILILSIIQDSILAVETEIDKILPFVHKIWKPLVSNFSEDLVVMRKAFETLLVIGSKCGDFIKSRTMKEIWPKLLQFLNSQESIYNKKTNFVDFQFSNSYKLLISLLSEIGSFAKHLDLTEKEFELLVWHCLPFIKKNQPKPIQKACLNTLQNLIDIDADAFWFYYSEAFGQSHQMVPISPLFTVNFLSNNCTLVINHDLLLYT